METVIKNRGQIGNGVELINSIDKTILSVKTNSLDLSFNELADMYNQKELIISPEYQRLFRWSETLQSQFIESIILELPIPPIFVVEREDRVWELIDGLQRMSSWLHFKGLLQDNETNNLLLPLRLKDCDIIEGLNDLTFEDLPQSVKIKLKRSPIRVEIIGKDSSSRLKYDMFSRLNTNGLRLSNQEIRNCTIRLLKNGDNFMRFIISLSEDENFKTCIDSVADYDIEHKYNEELVLRFFAFKNYREKYKNESADFMTKYAELVADEHIEFDMKKEAIVFQNTFNILNNILEGKVFAENSRYGQYRAFYFEAFTLGIVIFLNRIQPAHYQKLKDSFLKLKDDNEFKEATRTKAGENKKNLLKRIELVEKVVQKVVGL